jgi:diguanylate cyclase (GGDEF)-like protein
MLTISLRQKLRKLGEYFVNYDLIQQSEEQYRARILASCLLVMCLYAWLIAGILLFEHVIHGLQPIGIFLSTGTGIFYIACLFSLKKTAKTLIIAQAFAIPLFLSLLFSSFITGGDQATSNQIMLLIPLIMFFTAGISSGLAWCAIILVSQLMLFIMNLQGFQFMQAMDAQTQIEQGFFHWLITLSGIVGIALVYERAHQNLVTQRNIRESDNRYLTEHDFLTGVINRHAFEKQILQHMKSTHKHKLIFSVFVIGINHFHQINARYGFTVGDNILLTLSTRFKNLKDIKIIARTNGSQFTLVTHAHTTDINADALITEILELASQPFSIGHQIVTLNITIGITRFSNGMMTSDELMIQAEDSLKTAQKAGLTYSSY